MKFRLKFILAFLLFSGLTVLGYASGVLAPEEMNIIEQIITFLENIDLNALHVTLAAIISGVLAILRLFVKKSNKIKSKNRYQS